MASTKIKIIYGDQVRRLIEEPSSYEHLLRLLKTFLEKSLPKSFTLQYLDSDEDLITLSSEEDFEAMIQGHRGQTQTLKIYLKPTDPDTAPQKDEEEIRQSINTTNVSEAPKTENNTNDNNNAIAPPAPAPEKVEPEPELKEPKKEEPKDEEPPKEQLIEEPPKVEPRKEEPKKDEPKDVEVKEKGEAVDLRHDLKFTTGIEDKNPEPAPARSQAEVELIKEQTKEELKLQVQSILIEMLPRLSEIVVDSLLTRLDNKKIAASPSTINHNNADEEKKIGEIQKPKEEDKYEYVLEKIITSTPEKLYHIHKHVAKTVLLRNSGKVAWPASTHMTNGQTLIRLKDCQPNEEIIVRLPIVFNAKPGKYTSTWKLGKVTLTGEFIQFGPPLDIEYEVHQYVSESESRIDGLARRMAEILGGNASDYTDFIQKMPTTYSLEELLNERLAN